MQIKIKKTFSAPLLVFIIYVMLKVKDYIDISELQYRENIYLSLIILQMLIFVLPGVFYCRIRGPELTKKIKLTLFGVNKIFFTVFSLFALITGNALIKLGLYQLGFISDKYSQFEQYIPKDTINFANILYIIMAIAVLPAIAEEFVFRGIVFSEYRLAGGKLTAILMSSLLFAMLHFNLQQFPLYFFGGIVFACVMYVTDSLLAAVIVHVLNNSISLLLETQILNMISTADSIIFILFILTFLFLLFFFLCLHEAEVIYYIMGINGVRSNEKKPKAFQTRDSKLPLILEAFFSPTFLLCILFFIIVTFVL